MRIFPGMLPAWLKSLSIILILAGPVTLLAQPQVLPSVEIGSDEVAKAPLAKKLLTFPLEVEPDSLAPFCPWNVPLWHKSPISPRGYIRPLHYNLGIDSSFGATLQASLYPAWKFLPIASLSGQFGVPGGNRMLSSLSGHLQTRFSPEMLIAEDLFFQDVSADSASSTLYSLALNNSARRLRIGSLAFSDLRTQASYAGMKQESGASSVSERDWGFTHQHTLSWDRYTLFNGFWLQDSAVGFSLRYRVPLPGNILPEASIGLMTDFVHLLPSIDLYKRIILKPDLYLELSNRPAINSWPLDVRKQSQPFSPLHLDDQLTLTPLNLTANAYKVFGSRGAVQWLGFFHNSALHYNKPQLVLPAASQLPAGGFSDLLSNKTGWEIRFKVWDVELEQNLYLNLEHLPESDWRRKSYSPLLAAQTSIQRPLGNMMINADLEQRYFMRDERGQDLSNTIDLSLALNYPINPDLQITARLENIFNTPYHELGGLPERGRTFRIALRYLPLR